MINLLRATLFGFMIGLLFFQTACIPRPKTSSSEANSGRDGISFEEICTYTMSTLRTTSPVKTRIPASDFKLAKAVIQYIHAMQKIVLNVNDPSRLWSCAHYQIIHGANDHKWPLNLRKSSITDITALPMMEKIQWVDFRENSLTDLSVNVLGDKFPSLKGVDLSGNNEISTCGPLRTLTYLTWADLAGTKITDVNSCFESRRHRTVTPISYVDLSLTGVSAESFENFIYTYGKQLIGLRIHGLKGIPQIDLDLLPELTTLDVSYSDVKKIISSKKHPLIYLDTRGTAIAEIPKTTQLEYFLGSQNSTIIQNQKSLKGLLLVSSPSVYIEAEMSTINSLTKLEFGELRSTLVNKEINNVIFDPKNVQKWQSDSASPLFTHSTLYYDSDLKDSKFLPSLATMRKFSTAYDAILLKQLNLIKEIK